MDFTSPWLQSCSLSVALLWTLRVHSTRVAGQMTLFSPAAESKTLCSPYDEWMTEIIPPVDCRIHGARVVAAECDTLFSSVAKRRSLSGLPVNCKIHGAPPVDLISLWCHLQMKNDSEIPLTSCRLSKSVQLTHELKNLCYPGCKVFNFVQPDSLI